MSGPGYTWDRQSGTRYVYGPPPPDTRVHKDTGKLQEYDRETRSWRVIVCRVASLHDLLSEFGWSRAIKTSLRK